MEEGDLVPGDFVALHSLQSATQHNGKTGRLIELSHGTGAQPHRRWKVELLDSGECISVKETNLEPQRLDADHLAEFRRVTGGQVHPGQCAAEMIAGAEQARQHLVDDGQREGGFDLSDLINLPACQEGWVISWTQTGEVDNGKVVFVCLVMIQQPPPKPGEFRSAESIAHLKVGTRKFKGEPDGMDAMLVLDNCMWAPLNGLPRRPAWVLVAHRFGKKNHTTIAQQLWFRCVTECIFQPRSSAKEACDHYNTSLKGIYCQHCGAKDRSGQKKLLQCAKCKSAHYCSVECQHLDWPQHKGACRDGREGTSASKAKGKSKASGSTDKRR